MDERNWIWVGRCDALGSGFEEFVCLATKECKQVWDDGYVEIFEIA
jgi:hypothetical protein